VAVSSGKCSHFSESNERLQTCEFHSDIDFKRTGLPRKDRWGWRVRELFLVLDKRVKRSAKSEICRCREKLRNSKCEENN